MNIFKALQKSCVSKVISKRHYCETKLLEETWDIVVSGGGMVGSTLACLIGSSPILSGKKVLLLESSPKTDFNILPTKYSNRVFAINPKSRKVFESFNAWKTMCDLRVKEVKKMQVWEACSNARISFQHGNMEDGVAYIIENDVLLKAITQRLNDLQGNVTVKRGVKAVDYKLSSSEAELVTVVLEDGKVLRAKLLIGADGYNSLVRKKMNVKYISWNYPQKAIVATLKLSEPTANVVAWQRFLTSGPIALLPLTDELSSLVWTVPTAACENLLSMSDEDFVDKLNSALWDETHKNVFVDSVVSNLKNVLSMLVPDSGSVQQLPPGILSVEPNSRASFPLGLGHCVEYVAPRVALIGDAAHRIHPLAGQGVNLGFGDVECLVDCLETSVYNGNVIGDIEPLLEYETKRQRHVVPTMAAIDALNRIYKTQFTPLVLLRSLGVATLDSFYPIKDRIIRHASS